MVGYALVSERHGSHLPGHAHGERGKEVIPVTCCLNVKVQILELRFKMSCSHFFLHFHLQQLFQCQASVGKGGDGCQLAFPFAKTCEIKLHAPLPCLKCRYPELEYSSHEWKKYI